MRVRIEAEPGEAGAKAAALLKAIAADLAPASPVARAVLEALEEMRFKARTRRPMEEPVLEALRQKLGHIVREELSALEREVVRATVSEGSGAAGLDLDVLPSARGK